MATQPRSLRRKETQKGKRLLRTVALSVVIVMVVAALGVGWMVYRLLTGIQENGGSVNAAVNVIDFSNERRVSFVLMGHDVSRLTNGEIVPTRSDTLMVATFDPLTQEIDIVSIPRDLRVQIPGRSVHDKINAAYAYGGPELVMETITELFGHPMDGYIDIGVQAFVEAVDLIGGIDVDVPYNMHYEDPLQDLYIHIDKGPQHLDGYQAMGFVRERYGDPRGDLGRIERQQQFLQALADKMLRVENLIKIPQFVELATEYVSTNLSTQDMLTLAAKLRRPDPDKLTMVTLPTYDLWISGISYQGIEEADLKEYADRYIRGIDREANAEIQVDVFNSTDRSGWAAEVADHLRSLGYDVGTVGNEEKRRDAILIRFREEQEVAARVLARFLHDKMGEKIELEPLKTPAQPDEQAGAADGTGEPVQTEDPADIIVILGSST